MHHRNGEDGKYHSSLDTIEQQQIPIKTVDYVLLLSVSSRLRMLNLVLSSSKRFIYVQAFLLPFGALRSILSIYCRRDELAVFLQRLPCMVFCEVRINSSGFTVSVIKHSAD